PALLFFHVHANRPLLVLGQELRRQPSEDVVDDRLGDRDLGVVGEARGLEADVAELVDQDLKRHAVLQGHRHGGGEAVHQAGDDTSFFGHYQEDLAGLTVLVHADGDVAVVTGDGELVGDGTALVGQAAAHGARRALDHDAHAWGGLDLHLRLVPAGRERLAALAAVAVDGDGLE